MKKYDIVWIRNYGKYSVRKRIEYFGRSTETRTVYDCSKSGKRTSWYRGFWSWHEAKSFIFRCFDL